jgi:hypothetical protein
MFSHVTLFPETVFHVTVLISSFLFLPRLLTDTEWQSELMIA